MICFLQFYVLLLRFICCLNISIVGNNIAHYLTIFSVGKQEENMSTVPLIWEGTSRRRSFIEIEKNKGPISKSSVSTIKVPPFDNFPQCPCKGQYHSPSQAIGVTAFNHLISGLLVICMNVHMSVSQPMTYREDNFYGFSALHD